MISQSEHYQIFCQQTHTFVTRHGDLTYPLTLFANAERDRSCACNTSCTTGNVFCGDLKLYWIGFRGLGENVVATALELVCSAVKRRVVGIAIGAADGGTVLLFTHPLTASTGAAVIKINRFLSFVLFKPLFKLFLSFFQGRCTYTQ